MADWVVRLDEGRLVADGAGSTEQLARLHERMSSSSIHVSLGEVAASLALVALAVAVSFWRRADLERDIGIAVVRSVVQLTAIGYVISDLRRGQPAALVFALIAVMVVFGAIQARQRAKRVPDAFWPLLLALALAAAAHPGAGRRARASSSRSRATWSRSAGWWSATR